MQLKIDADSITSCSCKKFCKCWSCSDHLLNITGIGNNHTLSVPSDDATIRTLISIDNIIQSPIGISTAISVGLSSEVGISTNLYS